MIKNKITASLINKVELMLKQGYSETQARKMVRKETGLGKSQSNDLYNKVKKEILVNSKSECAPEIKGFVECEKKYVWNSASKEYIVFLKSAGKNVVVPEALHKALMKAYVEDMPLDEMAAKFIFPSNYILEYKGVFQWKRRSIAITDEQVLEFSVEECAQQMLEEKKFNVLQEYNKLSWKKTAEDARKWVEFEMAQLEPFQRFIENWKPVPYKPKKYLEPKNKGGKYLLLGLSDLHFGGIAQERYLYNQKEWNIDKTVEAINEYAQKVKSATNNRKDGFAGAIVCLLGDLVDSLTGFTDKGTKLETFPLGEEQLEVAFNSLVAYLEAMLEIFPTIECKSVPGNHSSQMDYTLSKMLEIYFRQEKRITFDVTSKRFLTFNVYDSLFLLDHGYSAVCKSRLPAHGAKRDNYINGLLLSKPNLLKNAKRFYFLSADQHHSESYESSTYEGFMFPTLVGGSRYADNGLYRSRQRQTGLVVTESGVQEVLYFFFD